MGTDKIFGSMGDLRVGKYVIIDEHPCRIASIDKSKPGKHGAAKCNVVAISLVDSTKHTIAKPSDADVEIPIVERKKAQIVTVNGAAAQLMDLTTYETFEVTIPEELKSEVETGKEIQYMDVMGHRILGKVSEGGSEAEIY